MSEILTDLSPAALAAANKANLYGFFRTYEQSTTMEFSRMDGIARWHSPHPYFWFNSVLCSRDATAADTKLIEDTIAYFQSRKIKSIGWWLEDGVSRGIGILGEKAFLNLTDQLCVFPTQFGKLLLGQLSHLGVGLVGSHPAHRGHLVGQSAQSTVIGDRLGQVAVLLDAGPVESGLAQDLRVAKELFKFIVTPVHLGQ